MPTESHVEFFEDTVLVELRLDLGSSVKCLNVRLDMRMCGALEMCHLTETTSRLLTYVVRIGESGLDLVHMQQMVAYVEWE